MTKRKAGVKKPAKDRAEFERQVAELVAALEKLPADRQEQFRQELERPSKVVGKRR